ncbi:hypothetical protein M1513_01705 [Patescibacteria group bacterium]|nr:hypothetical protein [Patescibacteria group bacterium]MCL5733326.1 hypothetical protein [Patescibacteria group bacterium]
MDQKEKFYQNIGRPAYADGSIGIYDLKRRKQDVLWDEKWRKFLKYAKIFKYLPFVDFVFAAGSMALGNVRQDSDFDVLVGCRQNRLFTARFFAVVVFGLLGIKRPKAVNEKREVKDKICLNHFVTPQSYRLSPPYDIYWNELYENLVPIFGGRENIENFFSANDWLNPPRRYFDDIRLINDDSRLKNIIERLLAGRLGDLTERILKHFQIKRIACGLKKYPLGYKPRFKYETGELEFHTDTSRIDSLLK